MNVIRHYDAAVERELVSLSNYVKNFEEEVAPHSRVKQGPALVATARDEVQLALAIAAFESFGHADFEFRRAHP